MVIRRAVAPGSAWASEQGLVPGQHAADGKSNEITAIPALLETLSLRNEMVTPYEEASAIRGIPLSDPWALRELRICVRDDIPLSVPASLFLSVLRQG